MNSNSSTLFEGVTNGQHLTLNLCTLKSHTHSIQFYPAPKAAVPELPDLPLPIQLV